jgi:hypothetical protein
MLVTAWNNGKHHRSGAGYGVRIREEDREHYFRKDWKAVFIRFENAEFEAKINIDKLSFWGKSCGELVKKEIGSWLITNNLAPWDKGEPPKLNLVSIYENHFELRK